MFRRVWPLLFVLYVRYYYLKKDFEYIRRDRTRSPQILTTICDSRANSLSSTMQCPSNVIFTIYTLLSQRDKLDRGKDNDVFSSFFERKGHLTKQKSRHQDRVEARSILSLGMLLFRTRRITTRLCSIFEISFSISSSRSAVLNLWYAYSWNIIMRSNGEKHTQKKKEIEIKTQKQRYRVLTYKESFMREFLKDGWRGDS